MLRSIVPSWLYSIKWKYWCQLLIYILLADLDSHMIQILIINIMEKPTHTIKIYTQHINNTITKSKQLKWDLLIWFNMISGVLSVFSCFLRYEKKSCEFTKFMHLCHFFLCFMISLWFIIILSIMTTLWNLSKNM